MASPRACIHNPVGNTPLLAAAASDRGFTLVEVLVVAALMAVIMGLGLMMSMDAFRGFSFRNDRDAVVAALQRARSQAINNICLGAGCDDGRKHGVYFQSGSHQMIVFQIKKDKTDFADRDLDADETIKFESNATKIDNASDVNVIFDQLSGNSADKTITLKDAASWRDAIITINSAGQIDY